MISYPSRAEAQKLSSRSYNLSLFQISRKSNSADNYDYHKQQIIAQVTSKIFSVKII